MRSIREYIRKTLFDSSSILPAYRHDAPQRVKEFAFVRAPVERLADVLSRGFVLPDKDHVYSLKAKGIMDPLLLETRKIRTLRKKILIGSVEVFQCLLQYLGMGFG